MKFLYLYYTAHHVLASIGNYKFRKTAILVDIGQPHEVDDATLYLYQTGNKSCTKVHFLGANIR